MVLVPDLLVCSAVLMGGGGVLVVLRLMQCVVLPRWCCLLSLLCSSTLVLGLATLSLLRGSVSEVHMSPVKSVIASVG